MAILGNNINCATIDRSVAAILSDMRIDQEDFKGAIPIVNPDGVLVATFSTSNLKVTL
jgi:hypothetical protein